jgi:plastocyanin
MIATRFALPMCAAAGLLLAGAAASTGRPEAGTPALVSMQISGFEPQVLTVKVGDRITWVNKDLFPHTATADDNTFDSGSVASSDTWGFVAKKPGTYTYTCTFHPNMKGTIKVQ